MKQKEKGRKADTKEREEDRQEKKGQGTDSKNKSSEEERQGKHKKESKEEHFLMGGKGKSTKAQRR